ncbi:MAG: 5-amino-6-(D-ribitylamino)uracil--L-tyrosine 4-hydroxyphenyl transferase CofH [Archaeoglobaceae archaeon]
MLQQYLKLLENPYEVLSNADQLRRELVGDKVTFVVNRNLNYTDICINRCKFCSFNNREKYQLTLDQIKEKVQQAVDYGCSEICIQGGLIPQADTDFYASIINAVRDVSEDIHIHAFSPMEILHAANNSEMTCKEVLRELKAAGLNSMPGTAAEILDDEIRNEICPQKLNTSQWVDIIEHAHREGISTTATMMYGHIESWEHRISHLNTIKEIQERTGGFTEFIPLPFMCKNNELGKIAKGSNGFEDLLVIAVSRMVLFPQVTNIQASWVKMGTKLVQAALFTGANDVGGTLIEEKISKSAGSTSGEFLTTEEIRNVIERAGRIPRQRDTVYNLMEI